MPYTKVDGKSIHFEVHGAGEPLLFLNGALMSTQSWGVHVEAFSKRYRLILMDFFGQGESDIVTHEYTQDLQVEAIRAVLDAAEVSQAHIFSSSYGAQVGLGFALRYQQRVKSLILQGVKSFADDPHSRAVGQFWIDVAEECDAGKLWDAIVPRVYGADFYNAYAGILNERKILFANSLAQRSKEWYIGWAQLMRSCLTFNVRDRLHEIRVPALIVAGECDTLVPPQVQQEVHEAIPGSAYVVVPGSGHAPYVDKPREFQYIVLGFLEAQKQL
jgi:3-oxoadipate enol-lactonase